MAQDIVSQLKDKERRIRELQSAQARLEGKRDQVVSTLKKDFGVSTLVAGKELKDEKEKALDKVDLKIRTLVGDLDKEMAKSRG